MKLRKREMTFVILAGIIVIGLLYYTLIISPAMHRQVVLKKYISRKEADLEQMKNLQKRWQAFQKTKTEAESRLKQGKGAFTLLSFLENLCRQVGIETRIQYLKPLSVSEEAERLQVEAIEIGLTDINIKELTAFLSKIENSERLLTVHQIKIQRKTRGKRSLLKITLQVKRYMASAA